MFDSCDRYLKTCLDYRAKSGNDAQSKGNLRIVVPIVKLKAEQFKRENLNIPLLQKFEKLEKIIRILDAKMEQAQEENTEWKIEIKAELLKL